MTALPRCPKHNRPIFKGETECFMCKMERTTPEEREAGRKAFLAAVEEIIPFAERLRAVLLKKGKLDVTVRVKCPNKKHEQETYIRARLYSRGRGREPHLHFACESGDCHYNMMQ